jgi:non-ribosomal peptide synthetase component F
VARFVDTVADGHVHVAQLVPSYLEVVLTYLEQNARALPDLHCCSVTGEALKLELAQRWFSLMPGIKLVNAYGLTETSDDTNHEVMRSAPEGRSVPLGPAVQNVRVYVVDEKLRPVPLGAPGAIVFSGVCVGRGYVNDPERTRLAFVADPHRQGERLYRSGDYGRWRPDGKLEFLGRRDHQVKIRGHRIEIGEIESALLRVNGVRAAAAVVAEGVAGGKRLVGFYVGSPHPAEALRAALSESLPSYMIPSAFHRRDDLPLTANGKVDSKALVTLAEQVEVR